MADEIEIGEGYVKVTTRVDDKAITRDAGRSGEQFQDKFTEAVESRARVSRGRLTGVFRRSGEAAGEGYWRGADGRLRDGNNRFVKESESSGRRIGLGMLTGLAGGLVGLVTKVGGISAAAVGPILTGVVPAIGAVASVSLAAAPAVAGVAVGVANFATSAVAAAPALYLLKGQIQAIAAIVTSFGPALLKAVDPVVVAFKEAQVSASKLATEGVEPLARKFVQLNMPAIAGMLDQVARATNDVVTYFLAWTNTSRGVRAISEITKGIGNLAEGLSVPVAALGISFVDMLGRISAVTSALGVDGLTWVLLKLNGMLDRITADTVITGIQGVVQTVQGIGRAIQRIIEIGSAVWDFYQRFRTEIHMTVDALGILAVIFGGPVTAAIAAAGLIIRHWDLVKQLFSTAREWFSGIQGGSDIMDRLKTIANDVWLALQRAFFTIRDAVQGPLRELGEVLQGQLFPAFGNLLTAIGPLIPVLIDRLAPAIGRIIGGFIEVITVAAKVVSAVINFAVKVGSKADEVRDRFGKVVTFFRELPGKIKSAISNLPSTIGNILSNAASRAAYLAGYLVGRVIREVILLPGKITNAVRAVPGVMGKILSTTASVARNGSARVITGAVSFFRTLPGKARSAIAGVPGRIKSVFSGASGWLVSAGKNVLKGLVNGIRSQIGATVSAVKGVGGSVIGGLKSGLGINSPSILAEREVGKWVLPGVTRGIKRTLPVETRKIATMAPAVATAAVRGRMADTAKPKAAPVATTSRIENLNVNIRGVLDPSDPVALRRMVAQIYEELAKYERSFA